MRLIYILILFLSPSGSDGFSVDYAVNNLTSCQGLFGSLSQNGGTCASQFKVNGKL